MNVLQKVFYFHKEESEPSLGQTLIISNASNLMTLEVVGTSTDFELEIMGKSTNNFIPINGIDMTELDYGTKITHMDSIWEVGLTGLREIKVRLNSISNGEVSVVGRVVG